MDAHTEKQHSDWYGQWIWTAGGRPRNQWTYFRKQVTLPEQIRSAVIEITADSAYELYLNGHYIGRGPARGYPFHYFYDSYDITPYLEPGTPLVIGVIASHMGDHSMCYMQGSPGLLCDLSWTSLDGLRDGIGTDHSWLTLPYSAMNQDAPRISKQLEFEEHFDAALQVDDWNLADINTEHWMPAHEVGLVGSAPWSLVSRRPIPHLTETPVAPTQILAVELAQPRQGIIWNFDLREFAQTDEHGLESSPPGTRGWVVYSEIHVAEPCEARITTYPDYEIVELRVNDQQFRPFDKFHPKTWTVNLHAGGNLIMLRNVRWPAVFIEADKPFTLSAARSLPGAIWIFAGPFDERSSEAECYWNVAQMQDLPLDEMQRALTENDNHDDIFVTTTTQQYAAVKNGFCHPSIALAQPRTLLANADPLRVHQLDAMLHDNAEWTEIAPHSDGDIHLVIDFGREVIGYIEFEIDAPAGAVLDANGFEAIDESGIYWMGSMRNTFRYSCREGRQRWRSHRRRGFRYLSLTLRQFARPIRIRHLNLYLATYPVQYQGAFRTSDTTLNQIWETAAYTVQMCMLDTYVDCPGFEQVFWVGDARNSSLVNANVFGSYALTAHCNSLVADSMSAEMKPIIPEFYRHRQQLTASHVVSGWFDEIPMWTFLWVWMVWEHYLYTGDQQALLNLYPAVRECMHRAETHLSPRRLYAIDNAWNMMDHAANDSERWGEIIGNSAMFARALDLASQIADLAGDAENRGRFTLTAERVRAAINTYGWSEERQAYVDTVRDASAYQDYLNRCNRDQLVPISFADFNNKLRISEQTNTLALLCNCVPPERVAAVLPFVTAAKAGKFVASRTEYAYLGSPDVVVTVGSPWFLFFTLETLIEQGCVDDALDIIREQWKKMLDKGATTFWETFPGDVSKGHWSRSLCHGWSGAPAYFLSTTILGVKPLEPGFTHVQIAPQSFNLSWAEGSVPTPYGLISVRWWLDDKQQFQIRFSAPPECDVVVITPEPKPIDEIPE